MKPILDAVAIILTHKDSVFAIKRQNFLKAFPGYWAFPGGKVDEADKVGTLPAFFKKHPRHLMNALIRESHEELGIDLIELAEKKAVVDIFFLGLAITPDFNPYRFATYFFKVELKTRPKMKVDENEAFFADWMSGKELLDVYRSGRMLAVPPVLKTYSRLAENIKLQEIKDLDFTYDDATEVPMIESINGLKQLMPLSNTLPPANRTNCFVIGDKGEKVFAVDPSPKDEDEYKKLVNTIKNLQITDIFITHHHIDHCQYADQLARDLNCPISLSQYTHDKLLKRPGYFKDVKVRIVKEGDVVTKWLGKIVKVFEIPGHDEGQLALAPESQEWFIAGDLFQGAGTVVVGGEEGDMIKYFNTLRRVIQLNPQVLFPSHGIGLGGVEIMKKTLEHRLMREEQVKELYLQGHSEDKILSTIYFETPSKLLPYALENIRSHLKKLKIENKLS
ncbi:MAG: MBL fold metallo-hydrolase [Bacteriovoracaceae bacterium]|nr:MBL fold metallo-hydrolase [Bacteriovoracaceae bacterium]